MAEKSQDEKAKSNADKKAGERYQDKVSLTNKDVRRDETANRSDTKPEDDRNDKSRDIDNPSDPQDNNPGGGMRSSGSGAVHGGEEDRPGQSPHDDKQTEKTTSTPAPDHYVKEKLDGA